MSAWPDVAIQIITYDRPREIRRVIDGLRKYLRYEGKVAWCLCDDGSPTGYVSRILADYPDLSWMISRTERRGWGGNANAGLKSLAAARFDYIFSLEDDYVPFVPLEISRGVALMASLPGIALVRYDGLEGHALDIELRECHTEPFGMLSYMRILKSSPFLFVYSNRPHLKHKSFHEFYGLYPEGLYLGHTEEDFARTVKDRPDGPWVAVLTDGVPRKFDHIGRSWQGSASDMEVTR